jgi:hypothetical protein
MIETVLLLDLEHHSFFLELGFLSQPHPQGGGLFFASLWEVRTRRRRFDLNLGGLHGSAVPCHRANSSFMPCHRANSSFTPTTRDIWFYVCYTLFVFAPIIPIACLSWAGKNVHLCDLGRWTML